MLVFLFGAVLILLGLVMLLVLFAAPVASPVADVVTGGIVGRATRGVGRSQRTRAAEGRRQESHTQTMELRERRQANNEGAAARRAHDRSTSGVTPSRRRSRPIRPRPGMMTLRERQALGYDTEPF